MGESGGVLGCPLVQRSNAVWGANEGRERWGEMGCSRMWGEIGVLGCLWVWGEIWGIAVRMHMGRNLGYPGTLGHRKRWGVLGCPWA